jgi:hypothetical protein
MNPIASYTWSRRRGSGCEPLCQLMSLGNKTDPQMGVFENGVASVTQTRLSHSCLVRLFPEYSVFKKIITALANEKLTLICPLKNDNLPFCFVNFRCAACRPAYYLSSPCRHDHRRKQNAVPKKIAPSKLWNRSAHTSVRPIVSAELKPTLPARGLFLSFHGRISR